MKQPSDIQACEGGTILYGVPKVGYGTYEGCTPFPICLKACANYLGDELEYDEIMATSAAGFRLTWDVSSWNGGNVDICFAFDDERRSYETGLRALGREYEALWRTPETTKEAFIAFIRQHIDAGNPIIARGIIGPPEACIIAGYRDEGNTLLGWNFFQDNPEFGGSVRIDDCGYFVTDTWWENADTRSLFAILGKSGGKLPLKTVLQNAVTVLSGRQWHEYAKGVDAYDPWKKAMANDADFPPGAVMPLLAERLMCHGDALDCLSDGRWRAGNYIKRVADQHPAEKEALLSAAECLTEVSRVTQKMIALLGGWQRGEEQMRKIADPGTRRETCALIDQAKAADKRALALLEGIAARMENA